MQYSNTNAYYTRFPPSGEQYLLCIEDLTSSERWEMTGSGIKNLKTVILCCFSCLDQWLLCLLLFARTFLYLHLIKTKIFDNAMKFRKISCVLHVVFRLKTFAMISDAYRTRNICSNLNQIVKFLDSSFSSDKKNKVF